MVTELEVRTCDGEVLCSVAAKASTRVHELKVLIELAAHIPPWEQTLFVNSNGDGTCGEQLDTSFAMRENLGLRVFNSETPSLLLVRLSPEDGDERQRRMAMEEDLKHALSRLNRGASLADLGRPLNAHPELVLKAISKKVTEMRHADPALLKDPSFMASAVRVQRDALEYAARELWDCKEFVLPMVNLNGRYLQRASRELQEDREVVETAIDQSGLALQFASEELRGDRELVYHAVRQRGVALIYASRELKEDREIVLEAVRNDRMAIVHASSELKQDPEVRKLCEIQRPNQEVTMARIEAQRLIKEQFRRADKNKDGTIDVEELGAVLRSLDGTRWTQTRIYRLLNCADINHDGVIDIDEFVNWITSTCDVGDLCVHSAATKWIVDGPTEQRQT